MNIIRSDSLTKPLETSGGRLIFILADSYRKTKGYLISNSVYLAKLELKHFSDTVMSPSALLFS